MPITPELHADPILAKPDRLVSLDAFRGATIAGMLLVNNPGNLPKAADLPAGSLAQTLAEQLRHTVWHGVTFTDFIFPFFLFIVGVAMPYADAKHIAGGGSFAAGWLQALRRALGLFAVGMFLQSVSRGTPTLSMEVLQRIAVCYFLAFVVLRRGFWTSIGAAAGLYAAYWTLMVLVRAPEVGWPQCWEKGSTIAEAVDLKCLRENNNEGFVSTLPAITNVIFGILAGRVLRSDRAALVKIGALVVAGTAGIALGLAWSSDLLTNNLLWTPLNKILWTPSYALLTSGAAAVVLAASYLLVDVVGLRPLAWPFVVCGSNAIAIYAFTRLFVRWIFLTQVVHKGTADELTLRNWLAAHAVRGFGPIAGSIAYSALVIGTGWLFCLWLWRRKIFLKV